MDAKNIIPKGTLAKYKLEIKDDNFDLDRDDFSIELVYGMRGKHIVLQKSDCIIAPEGCFFSFPTDDMIGKVTAVCHYLVGDNDTGGSRPVADIQFICFVSPVPCPTLLQCPACAEEEHTVIYTRITESDVTTLYSQLCDCDGNAFVTRDLLNLYVLTEKAADVQDQLEQMIQGNS